MSETNDPTTTPSNEPVDAHQEAHATHAEPTPEEQAAITEAAERVFTADHMSANPWHFDLANPRLALRIASERLSIVRYVFLVQIEDGITSASQRAALEYADAVLIGWPDDDNPHVVDVSASDLDTIRVNFEQMQSYIARFVTMERDNDIDGMTNTLIRVTERVANIRRLYEPDFLLPTFAEIRRVVEDEWNEDMDRIDASTIHTDNADDQPYEHNDPLQPLRDESAASDVPTRSLHERQ